MEGNSCWSKPILETRLFAKGRANFHHNKVAGTGRARPSRAAMQTWSSRCQQRTNFWYSAGSGGMEEMLARPGLSQGWQDSVLKSRAVPVGCRWADGDNPSVLQSPLSLAPGSFPFRGSLPISASSSGAESPFCPQNLCYHLGDLSQRNGRFCLFV